MKKLNIILIIAAIFLAFIAFVFPEKKLIIFVTMGALGYILLVLIPEKLTRRAFRKFAQSYNFKISREPLSRSEIARQITLRFRMVGDFEEETISISKILSQGYYSSYLPVDYLLLDFKLSKQLPKFLAARQSAFRSATLEKVNLRKIEGIAKRKFFGFLGFFVYVEPTLPEVEAERYVRQFWEILEGFPESKKYGVEIFNTTLRIARKGHISSEGEILEAVKFGKSLKEKILSMIDFKKETKQRIDKRNEKTIE